MKKSPKMPLKLRTWLILSRILAPLFVGLAWLWHRSSGADAGRFQERLGHTTCSRPAGQLVWLHAASLGEISQTRALLEQLNKLPDTQVLVTTFSGSGADWVAQELPQFTHQFIPLDTPRAVAAFLNAWSPDCAMFIEGDLWPHMVIAAHDRNIPLLLLNARPSKSRKNDPASYRYLMAKFQTVTCKSNAVRNEFLGLGMAADTVHSFGDLRAEAGKLPIDETQIASLQTQLGTRRVWIAASSHADDEAAILTACRTVLKTMPDTMLIWAPRHPSRAAMIMAKADGLNVVQRSLGHAITAETNIYLADTLGEFGTLFSCTSVVFLGGAFGDEGGHNPFEPAQFGCTVLTGPHHSNHAEGFAALVKSGSAIVVADGTALGLQVAKLLRSPSKPPRPIDLGHVAVEKTVALIAAAVGD